MQIRARKLEIKITETVLGSLMASLQIFWDFLFGEQSSLRLISIFRQLERQNYSSRLRQQRTLTERSFQPQVAAQGKRGMRVFCL